MTKSYIFEEITQNKISESLEQNIIARRFTMSTITKQLIYNLHIYFRDNATLTHIIVFMFLSFIQLFFYTLGAHLIKLRYGKIPSLIV